MKYPNIIQGVFVDRPNRFLAHVKVDGRTETVHVKNTGRCRELLLPGAEVWLTAPGTAGRKTKYDLVAVRKHNGILINIDSQAPNAVVREWLETQPYDVIRPEYSYGESSDRLVLEVLLAILSLHEHCEERCVSGVTRVHDDPERIVEGLCGILSMRKHGYLQTQLSLQN